MGKKSSKFFAAFYYPGLTIDTKKLLHDELLAYKSNHPQPKT